MLIAALTLLLLGTALAARGLIGRRLGDEPRCRKCKYNLTGVESKECPECGRPWTPETAARGLRHRRKFPLILGLLLLPAGGVLLAPGIRDKLQTTNLFQYLPTAIVIPAAARGSSGAFDVIEGRLESGVISPSQLQDIIATALDVQQGSNKRPSAARWVKILTALYWKSALSKQQQERYFRQMVQVYVSVPAQIEMSESGQFTLPIWFYTHFQCDSTLAGHVWRAYLDVSLDSGEQLFHQQFISAAIIHGHVIGPGTKFSGRNDPPNLTIEVAPRDPRSGPRRLIIKVDAQIFTTETSPIPLRWSGTSTLSTQFELVTHEAH